uniref:Uncharacterized protein n=1 Tax=Bursaphelenchus xylophilus TaxID=6326 RepID=A0A1I7RS68_BURXY
MEVMVEMWPKEEKMEIQMTGMRGIAWRDGTELGEGSEFNGGIFEEWSDGKFELGGGTRKLGKELEGEGTLPGGKPGLEDGLGKAGGAAKPGGNDCNNEEDIGEIAKML